MANHVATLQSAIESLLEGNYKDFRDKRRDYSNYLVLLAMSEYEHWFGYKAKSIIVRAKAYEPMDLDLEAEGLYLEVLYAILRKQ